MTDGREDDNVADIDGRGRQVIHIVRSSLNGHEDVKRVTYENDEQFDEEGQQCQSEELVQLIDQVADKTVVLNPFIQK